jgi:hypothetical protein
MIFQAQVLFAITLTCLVYQGLFLQTKWLAVESEPDG